MASATPDDSMTSKGVSAEWLMARPCCAVMRHAERADMSWELEDGYELGNEMPFDPALSKRGMEQAAIAAAEMLASMSSTEVFHVVVSSPYMRCIQTAVEVCKAIGPNAELMIDEQFGEIYGPDIMGEEEPANLLRPRDEARQYCRERHVKMRSHVMGARLVWPENLRQARLRFMQRFLRYLHRAALTGRNFVVVTHADGVAAALCMMPSMEGRILKKVEFCGFFVAQAGAGVRLEKIKSKELESDRTELTPLGNPDIAGDGEVSGHTDCSLIDADFAWQVSYSKIKLGHRADDEFEKRIKRWSRDSDFSEEEISRLLRFLPDGDDAFTESSKPVPSLGEETMTFAGCVSRCRSRQSQSSAMPSSLRKGSTRSSVTNLELVPEINARPPKKKVSLYAPTESEVTSPLSRITSGISERVLGSASLKPPCCPCFHGLC